MSDLNTEIFSLADIADLDATEIQEIRFESLPGGTYDFEVSEATLEDYTNKDDDPRVKVTFKFEVIGVQGIVSAKAKQPGFDQEDLIGKSHTEKLFIVTDEGQKKAVEGVGRVKAFIWDLGCDNVGVFRDIIESTVGHKFTAKILETRNPNDASNPYANLKLDKRPAQRAA